MQSTIVSVMIVVLLANLASTQVPIPSRPDGYGVGGPADAHVVVEMFADLLCPDCQAAWPTVLQLAAYYGTRIHFRLHTFPLPYHTNAFVAAQGLHVVANVTMRNIDAIYKYATEMFKHQAEWYNSATAKMTIPQVVDSIASFVDTLSIVTKEKFLAGMMDDDINDETRISWKYACSRGVVATPTFLINGVITSADASWSLKDWQSVIDPILATVESVKTCPAGQAECDYAPHKSQCCLAGERCIKNVGCRCFNLKNGNKCA